MKLIRSGLLAAVLCAVASIGQAADGKDESPCGELKAAKARLESNTRELSKKYRSDRAFIARLEASGKTWRAYRDAQVDMLYPHKNKAEYGTVWPDCQCQALLDLTNERIKVLEQWSTGVPMGEVCAGSRPVRK